ncbi:MAG: hypothetical protein IRD7MM_00365 [Candidatus Midichloria mitochondrii]
MRDPAEAFESQSFTFELMKFQDNQNLGAEANKA